MELAIAITAFVISLITALVVFLKNPRNATNAYFALLVFFIGAYPVFNYLAVNSASSIEALTWAKFILFVSIPQGPLLYFFAKTYPSAKFTFNKKRQVIIGLWVVLNLFLASLGLIFQSVSVENHSVSIQPGPLVPSFGLLHVSTIIAGLVTLYKKYKRSSGSNKSQLTFIFYGILVSFSLTFLITFVLPLVLNNTLLLAVSPIFLTLSVVAAAYAIVRHKLFDIRSAVARSVAYVLSLGLLLIGYSIASLVAVNQIAEVTSAGLATQVANALLFFVAVISYPSIKLFFDRTTNRLFFRDAYDTQTFLDELNSVLVGTIELDVLLRKSSEVIVTNIKTESCIFSINGAEGANNDYSESQAKVFDDKELELIHSMITESGYRRYKKVIVADEIAETNPKLKAILDRKNVAVVVALSSSTSTTVVGYMLLGYKKSGNPFSSQDIANIDIIASELVIAIQNSLRFEEIQAFNATLQNKINNATKDLQKTNEKLQALDETKDEFISMASHQLRTPLTSVKGYLSMVLEGDAGELNEMQKKLLDQAFTSSQRMVYLIADLLNVSRLRTGKFIIDAHPTNLAEVVEGEISQLIETAAGRNLKLTFAKPKEFPTLMLDETKIRQVIMNFTDNAIYYTPAGGKIEVALKETAKSVEFTVTDNGIGVPKSEQHHLFSKFYRAGNAKKARPDGTGLGLFMAKKVIVAQGGALIFHTQEGKGSTFGFSFAKAKLLAPKTPPVSNVN